MNSQLNQVESLQIAVIEYEPWFGVSSQAETKLAASRMKAATVFRYIIVFVKFGQMMAYG